MNVTDTKTNAFYELEKELYGSECEYEPSIYKKPSSKKGSLGCKDDCSDYPNCHPSCRVRWYHK